MNKLLNDPRYVSRTPIFAAIIFAYADIGQIYRMWSSHTAAGQNIWSWVGILISLVAFLNFYRVCCKDNVSAIWTTVCECVFCAIIIATIFYYQNVR